MIPWACTALAALFKWDSEAGTPGVRTEMRENVLSSGSERLFRDRWRGVRTEMREIILGSWQGVECRQMDFVITACVTLDLNEQSANHEIFF